MKDLRTKVVRSSGWILGTRVISQVVSFGFGIALARLLVPDDFGLVAMVMAFAGMAGLLSDVGLGAALVQKKNVNNEHFSSVFWLNLILGASLGLALYLSSPWISFFYERSEVESICKVLSFSFFIGAFAMVPRTIFVKELQFKYIALSDLVSMVVAGVIAITMAINGFGYWSLIAFKMFEAAISAALIWCFSSWRPNSGINRHAINELLRFSLNVFGTSLLQYFTKKIDHLLIGKLLGGQVLGTYDKAHSMMLFPLQNISHVIGSVMFPSMSKVQTDIARVRDIYLRSTRSIALFTFPMMAGVFIVSDSFVLGVLGPQWAGIIPILKILCVAGLVMSVVTVTGAIYTSLGRAALQFRVNLLVQPIRIVGVIIGINWGVMGVATGYTVALIINSIITLTVAGHLIDLKLSTFLISLAPTFLTTMIMAVLLTFISNLMALESHLFLFLVQTLTGMIIYWSMVTMLKLKAYEDVASVLRQEYVKWRQEKILD
jgi:O-antigen/teichoic acid export membrane protein